MLAKILFIILSASQIFNLPILNKEGVVLGNNTSVTENQTVLEKNNYQNIGLLISARSALAIDAVNGVVFYNKNIDAQHPIASISKLMSALVFLDFNKDFNQPFNLTINLKGENLSNDQDSTVNTLILNDLFYASLVGSLNDATLGLVKATGVSQDEFVARMNDKAHILGMHNTFFAEPTGLSEKNISTAKDLILLFKEALKKEEIKKAISIQKYIFMTSGGQRVINNTNLLLNNSFFDVGGGKTGYTQEAGHCLITQGRVKSKNIISVVLGAESENARFQDTKALYWWVENNYSTD